MRQSIIKMLIHDEPDVVLVRQRAKQLAERFGFDLIEATHFATAASEIARNAFQYAKGGRAEFLYDTGVPSLLVKISDQGLGIKQLETILEGRYQSETGMGVGLIGAKRLSDVFEVDSSASGTTVVVGKQLPAGKTVSPDGLLTIVKSLAMQPIATSALIEARLRNFELLQTLDALQTRQLEIERLNRELEETNRGVLALYSELDDKARSLKQASELKSRFLSQMSHELRTPLNSIIMLTRLMQSGNDEPLPPETQKQAAFIQRAADGLLEMVNDLLDLAKIESGRVEVKPCEVSVATLWAALRGMFRPLIGDLPVELSFSPVDELPVLFTDDVKLSQVLRNLISNALKFTFNGQVRVVAELLDAERIQFSVADTGIGIAKEQQFSLFTEYVQLSEARGYRQKGTGLGLALCRRLVELLGGRIWCESELDQGSTFTFVIPVRYETASHTRSEFLLQESRGVS